MRGQSNDLSPPAVVEERIGGNDEPAQAHLGEGQKGRANVTFGAGGEDMERPAEGACRLLQFLAVGRRIARIDEEGDCCSSRHQFAQQFCIGTAMTSSLRCFCGWIQLLPVSRALIARYLRTCAQTDAGFARLQMLIETMPETNKEGEPPKLN